ncbi:hypothetical protein FIBSPDRAFT_929571 [Athelia psychrophila]|uniref:Uncharacterized protein n=1 Tax=Athelia psychrophila TaxID=1759441 RepID=A0A166NHW1_9AGAM|nr:hypothetical protein FIBSPDRAFT_929571 [Fibularhizoctonia sp. CBS 109695]
MSNPKGPHRSDVCRATAALALNFYCDIKASFGRRGATERPPAFCAITYRRSGYSNLTQNVTASDSQFWTDNVPWTPNEPFPDYPFIPHNHFNVSWSGDVTLDIWVTASNALNGSTDSIQALYSPGFPLVPFKEYDITLTIISYKMNGLSWLFFEPQVRSAVSSGSNTTTASFSCSWQSQRQITHRDLSAPSALAVLAGAISSIGGVYAFIDGVFALIFGRTMLAIMFGTRAISPFGILGMITRNRFKRLIHEQYPYLQEDIERGGMAAYVSEVAIDPGLVQSDSAHRRSRVATSSPGPRTDGYPDAGVIHLRSMESSRTRDSTGSLPYVVEAYEPSKKFDYE